MPVLLDAADVVAVPVPVPVEACVLLIFPVAADWLEFVLWSVGLDPAALAVAPGCPVT